MVPHKDRVGHEAIRLVQRYHEDADQPAVNPMLYKQNPMCARNNCAAAGAG